MLGELEQLLHEHNRRIIPWFRLRLREVVPSAYTYRHVLSASLSRASGASIGAVATALDGTTLGSGEGSGSGQGGSCVVGIPEISNQTVTMSLWRQTQLVPPLPTLDCPWSFLDHCNYPGHPT